MYEVDSIVSRTLAEQIHEFREKEQGGTIEIEIYVHIFDRHTAVLFNVDLELH